MVHKHFIPRTLIKEYFNTTVTKFLQPCAIFKHRYNILEDFDTNPNQELSVTFQSISKVWLSLAEKLYIVADSVTSFTKS